MEKMKKSVLFIIFLCLAIPVFAQIPYDVANKKGRIIYFSDGNGGDTDDIGANAFTLLTLHKAGLKNKLKLFVYSDKFAARNSNNEHEQANKVTVDRAISVLGYKSNIFKQGDDYFNHRNAIVNKVKAEVLKSSLTNPLYIIFAGEGGNSYTHEAFDELSNNQKNSKLPFVSLLSHSLFNELANDDRDDKSLPGINNRISLKRPNANGGGTTNVTIPLYSWVDLENDYDQANYYGHQQLLDQNGKGSLGYHGFATDAIGAVRVNGVTVLSNERWTPWKWLNTGDVSNANTKFIYRQMRKTIALPNKTKEGKADISDFGMLWFVLTGNKKGNPYELRNFFRTGNLPKSFFITNQADANGNKRKLGSNKVLVPSNFETDRNTNGKLKGRVTGTIKMLGAAVQTSAAKWFRVPTANNNEFLLAHANTGLFLVSNPGNRPEISNTDSNAAIWTHNNSILSNKGTNKELRPQGSNVNQANNGTANTFKWNFAEANNLTINSAFVNSSLKTVEFDTGISGGFKIYTSNSELVLSGNDIEGSNVTILNVFGNVLKSTKIATANTISTVDISNLTKGVYIVQVQGEFVNETTKFIKQ